MKATHCLMTGALLVAGSGLVTAQDAAAPRAPRPHLAAGAHGPDRMYTSLAMTDAQKVQAQAIFEEAHVAARSVHQSLRTIHESVDAAIQAGKSPSEVEQIAQSEGPLQARLAGIDAAARAKFYASLTPDQQQKYVAMRKRGPGPGGPMGRQAPPPGRD